MTGSGTSHGCISVLNGIVSGVGAVIGIALETAAVYSETGTERSVAIEGVRTDDTLARICVRRTLEAVHARSDVPYRLTVRSQIPPDRGLKSSSSVCNAVIKAVLDEHGERMGTLDVLKLGVECAKEAGVTVTGSFDDACGCEMGGFVVTDNRRNEIIVREPFPPRDVIICVPEHTKKRLARGVYEAKAAEMERIREVCRSDIMEAMTLNGRLIAEITGEPQTLIDKALAHGALAAGISGTGPAVAVVCMPGTAHAIAPHLGCTHIITETRRCPTYRSPAGGRRAGCSLLRPKAIPTGR